MLLRELIIPRAPRVALLVGVVLAAGVMVANPRIGGPLLALAVSIIAKVTFEVAAGLRQAETTAELNGREMDRLSDLAAELCADLAADHSLIGEIHQMAESSERRLSEAEADADQLRLAAAGLPDLRSDVTSCFERLTRMEELLDKREDKLLEFVDLLDEMSRQHQLDRKLPTPGKHGPPEARLAEAFARLSVRMGNLEG